MSSMLAQVLNASSVAVRRLARVRAHVGSAAAPPATKMKDAERGVTVLLVPDQPVPLNAVPVELRAPVHVVKESAAGGLETGGPPAEEHLVVGLAQIHRVLSRLPRVDAVIDLGSGRTRDPYATWKKLFFHLSPGGTYYMSRRSLDGRDSTKRLADELARVVRKKIELPAKVWRQERHHELSRSVRSVSFGSGWLTVQKANAHRLRLAGPDVAAVLPDREPQMGVRELAEAPGGVFHARCTLTHHGKPPSPPFPDEWRYPSLALHEYRGKIAVVRNSLICTERSILPESYRHHATAHPKNPLVQNASADFGRVLADAPSRTLEGIYYHVDSENPGHFGHIVSEDLSKLWGWPAAKKEHPDLKLLFRTRNPKEPNYKSDPKLEKQLFIASGVREADICWTEEPVYVEALCSASPMVHNQFPHHVNPQVVQVWDRVRRSLLDPGHESAGRVFISRRESSGQGNRSCRNVSDVERYFAERGFTIIYPELLSLREQVSVFARANVIAGFGGSGMYGLIYAQQQPTVIVLLHEAYTSRTEYLISAVRGGHVHYFWSPPDNPHPPGRWSMDSYFSPWEFDVVRHAPALDDVISAAPV